MTEGFGALRYLPPLFKEVWQTSPLLTSASVLIRVLRALLPVVMLYIAKLIVDEVVLQTTGESPGNSLEDWFESGRLSRLGLLLALEFGAAVTFELLGRLGALADTLLAERHTIYISARLMEHAATLDLMHFENSELQDKLERARRQSRGRSALVSETFEHAQNVLTVASFAVALVVYSPWLIVLLICAILPACLGEAHFNAQSYALNFVKTPERRELDYLRYIGASVETAKESKAFNLGCFLVERFRALAEELYLANRKLAIARAGWGALFAAFGLIAYYFAYVWIAWRTVSGALSIGDLTFLVGSLMRLRTLLEGLLLGVSKLAGQALFLRDLFGYFEIKPEIVSPPNARAFPVPMQKGFMFENVGFQYPGSDRWQIRNLDLEIRAGETVALVGENGAGKTTLVKLLARLYDPQEGRILLDGHDLRDYDLADLHDHIGLIFQDFVRYHFLADENIAVGRIDARDDDERIINAAEASLAASVIGKLPLGYKQPLGKRFRNGIELSGGEWQKIAIGRAYMREADLMILDEPTAALDARSEYEVFQRFKELCKGKTAILISHRFSTVRMADRIVVMQDGTVEETGRHEDLLARKGRYAELFNLQASGYR
jgi:ATP-binding cassette subfamily B protein